MKSLLKIALVVAAFDVHACGICIDDKVASCYDHAVVTGAKARGDAVAFLAIEGPLVVGPEMRGAVLRTLRSTSGVQRASARVSLENAALSFAYDPRRASLDAIRAAVDGQLGRHGLKVKLLRELR